MSDKYSTYTYDDIFKLNEETGKSLIIDLLDKLENDKSLSLEGKYKTLRMITGELILQLKYTKEGAAYVTQKYKTLISQILSPTEVQISMMKDFIFHGTITPR